MKRIAVLVVVSVFGASLFYAVDASAKEGFFDIISFGIQGEGVDKSIDSKIYASRSTLEWNDDNLDGNMDLNEVLTDSFKLYDRDGKVALVSPNGYTRQQLEDWASEHYEEILAILFPSGLSQSTGETEDAAMASMSLSDKFSKASPGKSKTAQTAESTNSEFKGVLEYLSIEANDEDGDAFSVVLGYSHVFGNGFELRTLLPYRYTSLDDQIDSNSHYAGLNIRTPDLLKNL